MQTNIDFESLKEIQQNEIEALQAIFMEDFHQVVNKTAWKVNAKREGGGYARYTLLNWYAVGLSL